MAAASARAPATPRGSSAAMEGHSVCCRELGPVFAALNAEPESNTAARKLNFTDFNGQCLLEVSPYTANVRQAVLDQNYLPCCLTTSSSGSSIGSPKPAGYEAIGGALALHSSSPPTTLTVRLVLDGLVEREWWTRVMSPAYWAELHASVMGFTIETHHSQVENHARSGRYIMEDSKHRGIQLQFERRFGEQEKGAGGPAHHPDGDKVENSESDESWRRQVLLALQRSYPWKQRVSQPTARSRSYPGGCPPWAGLDWKPSGLNPLRPPKGVACALQFVPAKCHRALVVLHLEDLRSPVNAEDSMKRLRALCAALNAMGHKVALMCRGNKEYTVTTAQNVGAAFCDALLDKTGFWQAVPGASELWRQQCGVAPDRTFIVARNAAEECARQQLRFGWGISVSRIHWSPHAILFALGLSFQEAQQMMRWLRRKEELMICVGRRPLVRVEWTEMRAEAARLRAERRRAYQATRPQWPNNPDEVRWMLQHMPPETRQRMVEYYQSQPDAHVYLENPLPRYPEVYAQHCLHRRAEPKPLHFAELQKGRRRRVPPDYLRPQRRSVTLYNPYGHSSPPQLDGQGNSSGEIDEDFDLDEELEVKGEAAAGNTGSGTAGRPIWYKTLGKPLPPDPAVKPQVGLLDQLVPAHFKTTQKVDELTVVGVEDGSSNAERSFCMLGRDPVEARALEDCGDSACYVITAMQGFQVGQAVCAVLDNLGCRLRKVRQLGDTCLTFHFTTAPEVLSQVRAALRVVAETSGTDVAVDADDVWRRCRRIAVLDMDSTLIEQEVIDELATLIGKQAEVKQITRRAMEGEIDFLQSLQARVQLLRGLPVESLKDVPLTLTKGAATLIARLQKEGVRTALISGGFSLFANTVASRLGIDFAYANNLEVDEQQGVLTGRLLGVVVTPEKKAELVRYIAQLEGCDLRQVIAIGDGANDIPMLSTAGCSVAFCAKPRVKEVATCQLDVRDLSNVLYVLGISR